MCRRRRRQGPVCEQKMADLPVDRQTPDRPLRPLGLIVLSKYAVVEALWKDKESFLPA